MKTIPEIKIQLEKVVEKILEQELRRRKDPENILKYYEIALKSLVKYHKLLSNAYKIAGDKEYPEFERCNDLIKDSLEEFRRWDKPIERRFKKLKRNYKLP